MDGPKLFWEGVPHFLIAYGEERGQLFMSFVWAQMYDTLTQISGLTFHKDLQSHILSAKYTCSFCCVYAIRHFDDQCNKGIALMYKIDSSFSLKIILRFFVPRVAVSHFVSSCRIPCRRVAFRFARVASRVVRVALRVAVSHIVSPCRKLCRRVASRVACVVSSCCLLV